jgi:hypothetical protein
MNKFTEFADQIRQGGPKQLTLRRFLALFGQRRRGRRVASQIRRALKREHLETNPPFDAAYMNSTILVRSQREASVEQERKKGGVSDTPINTNYDRESAMRFKDLAEQIREIGPKELTVRQLLGLFGQYRRGRHVAAEIRRALKREKLETEPSFEIVHIDAPVLLRSKSAATLKEEKTAVVEGTADATEPREVVLTIGQLKKANQAPMRVSRHDTVAKAITVMMQNDVAYLAVMSGDRTVDGILSWRTIGKAGAAKRQTNTVQHYLAPVRIVEISTPLFDAVRDIVEGEAVLVKAKDQTICGLVSAQDIANEFVTLSEPFLFLEQIENHLRAILERAKLKLNDVKELVNPTDTDRIEKVNSIDDLSFGETARAFGREDIWNKLHLLLDRAAFYNGLEEIRSIRNKVMHFHPDGISLEDREVLRKTRQMLQSL